MFKKRIITDIVGNAPYLVRWSIKLPFGLSLKLHQILRPDSDRCSHDHPWWMLRIILWGGYFEAFGPDHKITHRKPWRPWAPWRIYPCGAEFRHRILSMPKGSSWSLVLVGGRARDWGFYTHAGWIHWREFVNSTRTSRVMWCDDSDAPKGIE